MFEFPILIQIPRKYPFRENFSSGRRNFVDSRCIDAVKNISPPFCSDSPDSLSANTSQPPAPHLAQTIFSAAIMPAPLTAISFVGTFDSLRTPQSLAIRRTDSQSPVERQNRASCELRQRSGLLPQTSAQHATCPIKSRKVKARSASDDLHPLQSPLIVPVPWKYSPPALHRLPSSSLADICFPKPGPVHSDTSV